MTSSVQTTRRTRRIRPQTSAWLFLLAFFGVFCVLVATAAYLGWRYYSEAMVVRQGSVRVYVPSGISYQPRGSARPLIPTGRCADSEQVCIDTLREEDRIIAAPQAGYGQVASLVLPDATLKPTQIDIWAHPTGADLTLERYRVSRWTRNLQEVRIRQDSGYARYDLRANAAFDQVRYQVTVGSGVVIDLTPGGSYSVFVPRDENGQLVAPRTSQDAEFILVEVAVREGTALVRSGNLQASLHDGEKVHIDMNGRVTRPQPATWQLIADGSFDRYDTTTYNRPDGTDTWSLNSSIGDTRLTKEEQNGAFSTGKRCPPTKVDFCDETDFVTIAQFRRAGQQTRSFITGIVQDLDVDVSEYTSISLSMWVRVLYQSVPLAGVTGSECPLMIELKYKATSPTDQEQRYQRCIYSVAEGTTDENMSREPGITYSKVAPYTWTLLNIELRNLPELKSARYLQSIRIEARGHDYLTEFADASLVGR